MSKYDTDGRPETAVTNDVTVDSITDTVTTSPSTDFFLEIAKGNVTGHAYTIIRGHKTSINAADGFEDVWEQSGNMTYLSTAETMNVVSTDTNDTSAGTGLRTLLIKGVDNTGAEVSETVTMNGTTNVLTSNSYLRVNVMVGLTAGSGGENAGNITATASTAATVQDEMDAGEGVSQSSHHTIPLGKTGYLYAVELNADRTSGGTAPELEIKGLARSGGAGAAWIQLFYKTIDTSLSDEQDVKLPFPTQIIARTDIRFTVDTDQNNSECRTRMYLLIVDD